MSDAFGKKSSGVERRQARAQKELQEKRKVKIITIVVVAVLALLFIGALLLNSKFIRRTLPAITVGGVNFTAVEFDYFFNISYQEYRTMVGEQMGEYASSLLPSTDKPLASQIYDAESGRTWADFVAEFTIMQMSELVQYHNAAQAAGYVLPDEDRAAMEAEIEEFRQMAEMYSFYYPSFESMLQETYGININESSFLKISEFVYTANSFSAHIHKSFVYSESELDSYYAENADMLDIFTYRYFLVNSESISQSDYGSDEEYEEAKEAALAEANERAVQIVAGVASEEDFIAAALEYDEDAYFDPDSTLHIYPGSWLGGTYGPWMREAEREYGDVTTEDMTNGTYVVFFIERNNNDYRMTEMRQILMMREEVNPEEFLGGVEDPEYIDAFYAADMETWERAEGVAALFIEGGATEALLLEMMEEHSDDWTEGGFYDKISMDISNNKMVEEIEAWLFEDGRQYGDYELIRTQDYGFHLVFFMGYGGNYRDFLAEDGMRTRDYNLWKESLEPVESENRWAFILTQR